MPKTTVGQNRYRLKIQNIAFSVSPLVHVDWTPKRTTNTARGGRRLNRRNGKARQNKTVVRHSSAVLGRAFIFIPNNAYMVSS